MISITNKGSNYLARIMKIDNLQEIEGAKTLQKTLIDYQEVAISKNTKVGDIVVYFPAGAKIDHEYLSATNSFAKKEMNADTTVAGYFNSKGLVKATKFMKGQIKSTGYVVPAWNYLNSYGEDTSILDDIDMPTEFDTINGKVVVEKYVAPERGGNINGKTGKQAKKLSRLVDNQVYLHADTDNFRKMSNKISRHDTTTITDKWHGTSAGYHHVLVKSSKNLWQRFLGFLGANTVDTEYDLVIHSRRVIKNRHFDPKGQGHFFGTDVWSTVAKELDLKNKIPKGYGIYAEIVGYVPGEPSPIQKNYDYGCKPGEFKLRVYRVTQINSDGLVFNLSTLDAVAFCERIGLEHVPVITSTQLDLHIGSAMVGDRWDDRQVVPILEERYLGKKCSYCTKSVPAEGIVIRKEGDPYNWEAYKLKDFDFIKGETDQLEKSTETNIEDAN